MLAFTQHLAGGSAYQHKVQHIGQIWSISVDRFCIGNQIYCTAVRATTAQQHHYTCGGVSDRIIKVASYKSCTIMVKIFPPPQRNICATIVKKSWHKLKWSVRIQSTCGASAADDEHFFSHLHHDAITNYIVASQYTLYWGQGTFTKAFEGSNNSPKCAFSLFRVPFSSLCTANTAAEHF
jgi:hypothetical protein